MADQYRNIELERMFQDLGRALEANEAKRARNQAATNPAIAGQNMNLDQTGKYAPEVYQQGGGARGVPTARFPDADPSMLDSQGNPLPPELRPGPAMSMADIERRAAELHHPTPMTPQQQTLSGQLDAMGNQVVSGIQGNGPAPAPMGPSAGVSPGQLAAIQQQATQGMAQPAAVPQVQPVDMAGLDAYARMRAQAGL